MGFIYEERDQAKEKIQNAFRGVERRQLSSITIFSYEKLLIKDGTTNYIGLCTLQAITLTPCYIMVLVLKLIGKLRNDSLILWKGLWETLR
ncbi:hypothetical protein CR513_43998, partial [Mucuna pruriens]